MKLRNVVWISALVLVASAVAGVGAPLLIRADTGNPASSSATLSVVGTGVVTTKPDTAVVAAGVASQAVKAADAMSANADAMTKVIDALKAQGIDAKDLQTSTVSLDPRFDDQGISIVGYTASNSVSATVRDITATGPVIDAAVAAGANTISGPTLTRDDTDKLYRDALEEAVAQARLKATALARASGKTLGDIRSVSEGTDEAAPLTFSAAAAKDVAPTPIETGTTDVTANVRVVFALD
jgi:uncharacterized protein YggE